jgi:cell division protein FtsL
VASYIHGSLAVEEKSRKGQRVIVRETKKVVQRQRAIPVQEKLLYLFTVAVCVMVAGIVIWRYAQIYEINNNIHNIEVQLKQLEAENSTLKQMINKANNPDQLKKDGEKNGLTSINDKQVSQVPNRTVPGNNNDKLALKP